MPRAWMYEKSRPVSSVVPPVRQAAEEGGEFDRMLVSVGDAVDVGTP